MMKSSDVNNFFEVLNKKINVSYSTNINANNVLTLAYFSRYISIESLQTIFGYAGGNSNITKIQIFRLVKSGLLNVHKLQNKDSKTKSIYSITKKGIQAISPFLPAAKQTEKKSVNGKATMLHDYSCSLNFLHMLNTSFSDIYWFNEIVNNYTNTYGRGALKSIRTDAICYIGNKHRLYFEEDLGNETIGVLLSKIDTYCSISNLPLLDHKTQIILSFRKAGTVLPFNRSYSITDLKRLYQVLLLMENYFSEIKERTLSNPYTLAEYYSILKDNKNYEPLLSLIHSLFDSEIKSKEAKRTSRQNTSNKANVLSSPVAAGDTVKEKSIFDIDDCNSSDAATSNPSVPAASSILSMPNRFTIAPDKRKEKCDDEFTSYLSEILMTLQCVVNTVDNKDSHLSDLYNYIAELTNYINPYYLRERNHEQEQFAFHRRNSIMNTIQSIMYSSNSESRRVTAFQNSLDAFRKGLVCNCVATDCLENYFPYLFPLEYGLLKKVAFSISGYTTLSIPSYQPTKDIEITNFHDIYAGYQLSCRNAYRTDKGFLFIENVSFDLGAFVRCGYAHMALKPSAPYVFIMLVASLFDAKMILSYHGCGGTGDFFMSGSLFFCFLEYKHIGQQGKLFTLDKNLEPVYLPILQ